MGVTKLDAQHGAFLGELNKLHAAMMRGQGKSVTGPLLRNLIAGARQHFSEEEELMSSTGYPGLAHHSAEHQQFDRYLEELNARHEQGENSLSIPLLRFMRDWLSTHILQEDREYGPWLHKHGVS